MGVVTFLKLAGQVIVKGLGFVQAAAPAIIQLIPNSAGTMQTVSKDISEVLQCVITAEAMGQSVGLTGPQKLTAATVMVEQIVSSMSVMTGKTIANPELYHKAMSEFAQAGADLLNSLHAQVDSQSIPVSPQATA